MTIEVESRVFVGGASTRSSRSSASSTVVTPSRSRGEVCRRGKLHIVDLAGSERLGLSGCAEDPVALAETQAINLSLTALGTCWRGCPSPSPPLYHDAACLVACMS